MARWAVVGNITSQTFAFASGPLYPVGAFKPQSGLVRFPRSRTRLIDIDRVESSLRDRLRREQLVLVLLTVAEVRKYKAAADVCVPKSRVIRSLTDLDLAMQGDAESISPVDTELEIESAAPPLIEAEVDLTPTLPSPVEAAPAEPDELDLDGPPPLRPSAPSREELEALSYEELKERARNWSPPITARAKAEIISQMLG